MFGKGKIKELENQLTAMKQKLESAVREKTDLDAQLKSAKDKITELEQKLVDTDLNGLKEKARKTIVEYEGLKDLYQKKNQELDASREGIEEGFAREAAMKRSDLADEIQSQREDNQTMVSETVKTFAGSYQYYLDQVRTLMDALSQAAKETGESLFSGDTQNIKERFGAKVLEHLRLDRDSLQQDTGDLLLIGKEEAPAAEEAAEEAAEAVSECAEECMEEAAEVVDDAAAAAEEVIETVDCAAEEAEEPAAEAAECAAEEAVEAVAEEAAQTIDEVLPE